MGRYGCECAADVADAVEPAFHDFKGHEDTAWAEDSEGFRKHLILKLGGFQVMQNEDGQSGSESLPGKGQV